jgi:hypothetical protein
MRTIIIAIIIRSLLLLHGTVVVDKDKSAVVLGIGVTLGALVAWAQVALGIIIRQSCFGRALLSTSGQRKILVRQCHCRTTVGKPTAKGAWFGGETRECGNPAEGYISGERCRQVRSPWLRGRVPCGRKGKSGSEEVENPRRLRSLPPRVPRGVSIQGP